MHIWLKNLDVLVSRVIGISFLFPSSESGNGNILMLIRQKLDFTNDLIGSHAMHAKKNWLRVLLKGEKELKPKMKLNSKTVFSIYNSHPSEFMNKDLEALQARLHHQ